MSTITPEQHLSLIRARCVELLEIAEKRTSGEWRQDAYYVDRDGETFIKVPGNGHDATFIASCAGAAEAGWRSTIAAIDDWQSLHDAVYGYADGAPDASPHDKLCNELEATCRININHILAAWPLTLLQP